MPRSLLGLRFRTEPGGGSCLLAQGERDGRPDELEGLALLAGGLGQDGDGGGGSGEAELVAGQGAQVGEQPAEAAVGAAVLVVLAGGPWPWPVAERLAGATGFAGAGGSSSV